MVPASEHIWISFYQELVENLPPYLKKRCYYVSTESVHEFFAACNRGEVGPCVLVSGMCDFGVRLQAEHHPNLDIRSRALMFPYEKLAAIKEQYANLVLGPTCEEKNCRPTDKYIVRMDRHSVSTFDEIPENIKEWFCTNLDIKHPRATWIPFGLNDDGPGCRILPNYMGREKTKLLYVNFSPNNLLRNDLRNYYRDIPWVTYREQVNRPVAEYLEELAEHKFSLAPFGNGLDCFRTYETLYLGGIPIIERSRFAQHAVDAGLPVIAANSLFINSPNILETLWETKNSVECEALTKSFWTKRITEAIQAIED